MVLHLNLVDAARISSKPSQEEIEESKALCALSRLP
jgi:hypothetical protein